MRRPSIATLVKHLTSRLARPSSMPGSPDRLLTGASRAAVALATWCLAVGCGESPTDHVVRVRGGVGAKPFADAVGVASVELRVRSAEGVEQMLARANLQDGTLPIPDGARTGVGALALLGYGADGAVLAYGRTPLLELSGFDSSAARSVNLQVQKPRSMLPSMQWSDPPVGDGSGAPLRCAALSAQHVVVASPASTHAWVVDLLALTAGSESGAFTTPPVVLAAAGNRLLAIDAQGAGVVTSLDAGERSTLDAPSPVAWPDTIGAAVVAGEDGGSWIVLPTRTSAASDLLVHFDAQGAATTRKFADARRGGVATWAKGRGLVLLGGSKESVELLAASSQQAVVTHPRGPTDVASATAIDDRRLLVVHGSGSLGVFDLACTDCAEQPLVDGSGSALQLPTTSRADDAVVLLEGGDALVLRSGELSRIDLEGGAARRSVLATTALGSCLVAYPTGVVGVVAPGQALVHTVSGKR